jgi:hypothetical protein
MKTVSSLALVTAICVVIFWVFMALRPASAQGARPLSNYGRSHGYVSWPVYCGIAKCNDQRQRYLDTMNKPNNSQPTQNRSSKANHCDSLCQAKCQATWQRGGLPSVEACYAKWSRLHANGTARQCEAANRARLAGQPKLPGC